MNGENAVKKIIYGVAIGDAAGCPVQFFKRGDVKKLNIIDMVGHGTYNKPVGTWTDDTSMTLALADSLADTMALGKDVDYTDIMKRFESWLFNNEYTTEKRAFDMGQTCSMAIFSFRKGIPAIECGGKKINQNGNGSLMRISPIVFYLQKKFGLNLLENEESVDAAFEVIQNVSSLTHAHPVAKLGCCIYCTFLLEILNGRQKSDLRGSVAKTIRKYIIRKKEFTDAATYWERLFAPDFLDSDEESIKSSGYVVDTLEAAIWCFFNTENYRDCIIKGVNLGNDADTVCAVAGGLAGLYYGEFPEDWIEKLRGKEMLDQIAEKLDAALKV
ncbi:MAG: ADP-ribosylglycohydrolase family protein [Treponema sp.]|uniref:ADP-ribosylglycohydrolase family protein n=1 Tax=Treponema sp. TaxID=166 RepID=UPI0026010764|nr:ADP-ribosylglycohydrolase family protein [Treponema sp.]MBQ9282004.1 ADP-ribosylglycohydrolase family protein [Treponema sp.]